MIRRFLNQDGYRVTRGNHELYDGITAATLTLTGSPPSVNFRVAVTLSSVTGHADCTGSVVVGSETLTFAAAGKKTTTTALTALPTITTSGIDCNILVEAITTGGAHIVEETAIALKTRFENTQKSYLNSQGVWSKSQAIAYVMDSSCDLGTKFSQGGYDYTIDQVSAYPDLRGNEVYRKLYLGGKAVAPAGRAISLSVAAASVSPMMIMATYDADADGVVDLAEGIRVLSAVPTDLTGYADGELIKVGDTVYVVHEA